MEEPGCCQLGAASPTAAANDCHSDKYENKLPAHLAQSILMAGLAAMPAPSFPAWPYGAFLQIVTTDGAKNVDVEQV